MNEPLGIALEAALRRLTFGGYLYRPPNWYEKTPQPVAPRPARKMLNKQVGEIINAAARAFDISPWAIISPRKHARTCRVRFAVYALLRERLGYSTPKIAKATNRADHTTILAGLKRAAELLATDPEWAARYRAAEHALTQQ